ncbi:MAG: ABC transporter substrate-binding protein [Lentisphaerae bacterium]|nr:ABC transporter substrate-binding protein [Lentisphaerota bacterium]
MKTYLIIFAAIAVIALPFIFRQAPELTEWRSADPTLVVISPHNEAIRQEFAAGFSSWHKLHYGSPVKVDWRVIGGTTEIMRYLISQYTGSAQAWWSRLGHTWPIGGTERMFDPRFNPDSPPDDPTTRARFDAQAKLWRAFRNSDSPGETSSRIDLFFGGGTYDHDRAARQGLTVALWPPDGPTPDSLPLLTNLYHLVHDIPTSAGGEVWRNDYFLGNVLSTFGICYNPDRLADLGITTPPRTWRDLANPAYFGQIGITDPTKSGSVAKAFEMIIHEQCALAVAAAGFTPTQVNHFEQQITAARLDPGQLPDTVPAAYQEAVAHGWLEGINLIRLIGANSRYFTDGAGKVPVDVSDGVAAAGIAIDFYGRFQAESSKAIDGTPHLIYITPRGGSSVSADPISLLRGAPNKELALRFIYYVMTPHGQKLWNYRPGTPGGPRRFALCRMPITREFYPAGSSTESAAKHTPYTNDDLTDPDIDVYALAARFSYQPRWTARHFGIQRDLVKAMCLDSGNELRAAWAAIRATGGPAANPRAMELLQRPPDLPAPLNWTSAITTYNTIRREETLRQWTTYFRAAYRAAANAASQ